MQNNLKKTKHILFFSSWYPTRVNPTHGDFVFRHGESVSLFCKTTVLHVVYDSKMAQKIQIKQNTSKSLSEYIYYFRLPFLLRFLKPVCFLLLYFYAVHLYINQQGKPDIIHVHIMFPLVIIAFFCKLFCGIPYCITEHWTGYLPTAPKLLGRFKKWYIQFFSRLNSGIMPVSEDLQKALKNHGVRGQYTVVQNVVDTSLFYPSTNKDYTIIRVVHISHLNDEHKNISGILRVFKKVCEINSQLVLQIISENAPLYVKEYVRELGIQQNVQFLGYKNRQELAQILREASYLLLFSNYENFPCVIVEALASGIPVISSNVGGISEHVSEKNGILVEPRNEEQLYNAIQYMNNHYTEFNSNELHSYAVEHFSYESVAKSILQVYDKLLRNNT
ncbi:MAG: glycosyltransferase [Bacteroidales bacterium]